MADNVPVTPGSGVILATDDIGGVHYPINKLAFGPLDTATIVSTTNGLPVQQQGAWTVVGPLTDTELRASAIPVSLASTTITGSVAVTGTFWQATQPVSLASTTITGTVTTTVSGSVAVF